MDDHRILREGLRALLEREEDFSVVGEAGDGEGALMCIEKTVPDVVVLDVHLPDQDGMHIARRMIAARPEIKIIFLSAYSDAALVGEALKEGAVGFIAKEEAPDELVRAIRAVTSGQVYLSPIATTSLVAYIKTHPPSFAPPEKPDFSDRELEVLKLVVEGLRNKEIANRLGVGIKSVESYRARMMTKAGCSSPADLVRFALKQKLVKP